MNCEGFRNVVEELAGNVRLDERVRDAALAHADCCPECDAAFAEARSVYEALRSVALRDAHAAPPAHQEAALLAAFRREYTAAPQGHSVTRRMTSRWRALAAVATLAAAAAVTIFLMSRRPATPQNREPVAHASPASPSVPSPAATGGNQREIGPVHRQVSAASNRPSPGGGHPRRSEYVTSFVPLPFAGDSLPMDDATVVRMLMPRSALADFGLPISDIGQDESVLADFVVSEDGTPQAVRLVRSPATEFRKY